MHNHSPNNYVCPICSGLAGRDDETTLIRPTDTVHRDEMVVALINSFFVGKNSGHVIVVPVEHYENIYDLPDEVSAHISKVAKKIAVAMRATYNCEGITFVQNNEPAGGQHAFHYHLHIFPRYDGDQFYEANVAGKRSTTPEERKQYADMLRNEI